MATISPKHITSLAKYLKSPLGKITASDNVLTRTSGNSSSTGVINIIFSLLAESNSNLKPTNDLDESEIRQWLEYTLVYVGSINNNQQAQAILKDLNHFLEIRTYLVDNKLTVADIFLYYVLFNLMVNLPSSDKEKYMHVSRWFDNIQQDPELRQNNNIIDFTCIYLASLVLNEH